ncbi:MAG TPA: SRPBCC family protein [Burkholderiaceae bacterium]|jgi:hypothetical protein
MKILKFLLGLILLLCLILFGGGMFLSPHYAIARSQQIAATPDKIYPLIAGPRAWKGWSAWNKRDPNMAVEYSGPEVGAGAVWAWKSKTEGDGRMTFTAVTPPNKVDYELFFPDFNSTSTGSFTIEPKDGGSLVTWTMNGDMGSNPLQRWMGLFMNKLVGPDFQSGLLGLKALAEAKTP